MTIVSRGCAGAALALAAAGVAIPQSPAPRAARDAAKPPIQVTIDGAAAAGDFKIQSPDGRSLRWRLCDSDPQVPVQKFLLRTTLGR